MVWEEVDNDYRVGTIRGGNGARRHTHTHRHAHIGERVLVCKDGREKRREKWPRGWVE